MHAGQAKDRAGAWVAAHRDQWPRLRAAHLVGGLTAMADHAPFPAYKDVDLHLIVEEGSTMLTSGGPFMPIIESEEALAQQDALARMTVRQAPRRLERRGTAAPAEVSTQLQL